MDITPIPILTDENIISLETNRGECRTGTVLFTVAAAHSKKAIETLYELMK